MSFVGGIYEQSWTMTVAAGTVVLHAQASALGATIAAIVFGVASTLSLLACYLYFEWRGAQAVDRLRSLETRVTHLGPRVMTAAASIASAGFLAVGLYGLATR